MILLKPTHIARLSQRWLTLLLIVISTTVIAHPPKKPSGKIIYDFSDDWQVYSTQYQTYIPYLTGDASNSINLMVPVSEYKGYHLSLYVSQKVYLYINAHLWGTLGAGQQAEYNLDSLQNIVKSKQCFLTFYNPEGQILLPEAYIFLKLPEQQQSAVVDKEKTIPLNMAQREGIEFRDFAIIVAIVLLGIFAFLWNVHPKAFMEYYHLLNFLSGKNISLKSLSRIQLLFILNHSFLMAFAWMLWQKLFRIDSNPLLLSWNFSVLLQNIFSFTGVFFLLILGKYLSIYILASLLRTEKYIYQHFYIHLAASMLFYTSLTICLFITELWQPFRQQGISSFFFGLLILFHVGRIGWVAFNLNKLQGFRNVYLFSYLCATELLPALLGFRFLSEALV
jgi:uncharacterized membrane protein YidH (DUF202 family)